MALAGLKLSTPKTEWLSSATLKLRLHGPHVITQTEQPTHQRLAICRLVLHQGRKQLAVWTCWRCSNSALSSASAESQGRTCTAEAPPKEVPLSTCSILASGNTRLRVEKERPLSPSFTSPGGPGGLASASICTHRPSRGGGEPLSTFRFLLAVVRVSFGHASFFCFGSCRSLVLLSTCSNFYV